MLFAESLAGPTESPRVSLVELIDGCSVGAGRADVINAVVIAGRLFCRKKSCFLRLRLGLTITQTAFPPPPPRVCRRRREKNADSKTRRRSRVEIRNRFGDGRRRTGRGRGRGRRRRKRFLKRFLFLASSESHVGQTSVST